MIKITEHEDGIPIPGNTNEPFEIELSENPTTGYRWHISPDPTQLTVIDDHFISAQAGMPGASGKRSFTIKKNAVGETIIELHLYREWEGINASVKKHTFIIRSGS